LPLACLCPLPSDVAFPRLLYAIKMVMLIRVQRTKFAIDAMNTIRESSSKNVCGNKLFGQIFY